MKRWKSVLLFPAVILFLSVADQPVFAGTFSFSVGGADLRVAIDYEGTGTITHMNSPVSPPTPINRGRTSLQDINVMRATDLRIELSGGQFGFSLGIGQPGMTLISYRELFPHDPFFSAFEAVSGPTNCPFFSCRVFALTTIRAMQLQNVIDTYGPDNLFLALDMQRFVGFGSLRVFSAVTPIDIDVKPDDSPNTINPRSRGVIPVAILTTSDFDAVTVNWAEARFGATGMEAVPVHAGFDDVDGDLDVDLILHFKTQDTAIECGTSTVFLRAATSTGQLISGRDTLTTVGCK